jgi:hypothetical protein
MKLAKSRLSTNLFEAGNTKVVDRYHGVIKDKNTQIEAGNKNFIRKYYGVIKDENTQYSGMIKKIKSSDTDISEIRDGIGAEYSLSSRAKSRLPMYQGEWSNNERHGFGLASNNVDAKGNSYVIGYWNKNVLNHRNPIIYVTEKSGKTKIYVGLATNEFRVSDSNNVFYSPERHFTKDVVIFEPETETFYQPNSHDNVSLMTPDSRTYIQSLLFIKRDLDYMDLTERDHHQREKEFGRLKRLYSVILNYLGENHSETSDGSDNVTNIKLSKYAFSTDDSKDEIKSELKDKLSKAQQSDKDDKLSKAQQSDKDDELSRIKSQLEKLDNEDRELKNKRDEIEQAMQAQQVQSDNERTRSRYELSIAQSDLTIYLQSKISRLQGQIKKIESEKRELTRELNDARKNNPALTKNIQVQQAMNDSKIRDIKAAIVGLIVSSGLIVGIPATYDYLSQDKDDRDRRKDVEKKQERNLKDYVNHVTISINEASSIETLLIIDAYIKAMSAVDPNQNIRIFDQNDFEKSTSKLLNLLGNKINSIHAKNLEELIQNTNSSILNATKEKDLRLLDKLDAQIISVTFKDASGIQKFNQANLEKAKKELSSSILNAKKDISNSGSVVDRLSRAWNAFNQDKLNYIPSKEENLKDLSDWVEAEIQKSLKRFSGENTINRLEIIKRHVLLIDQENKKNNYDFYDNNNFTNWKKAIIQRIDSEIERIKKSSTDKRSDTRSASSNAALDDKSRNVTNQNNAAPQSSTVSPPKISDLVRSSDIKNLEWNHLPPVLQFVAWRGSTEKRNTGRRYNLVQLEIWAHEEMESINNDSDPVIKVARLMKIREGLKAFKDDRYFDEKDFNDMNYRVSLEISNQITRIDNTFKR